MKKILIIIILLLTACQNKNYEKNINDVVEEDQITDSLPAYIDTNPIQVGIYKNGKLVKEYSTKLANYQDITTFNIFYTQEEKLENSNIKYNWNKYYSTYQDIDNYKIGFNVSFQTTDGLIDKNVLGANDTYATYPYLYTYLYDAIHQENGKKYTHLKEEDMNEETILTSIKLFLGAEGKKITSPITITVFTYVQDDFDENNQYRGNSKYTIKINIE